MGFRRNTTLKNGRRTGRSLLHANLTATHRVSRPCGAADSRSNSFHQLVAQRARLRNAWAEIGVPLFRRHDLIPNLEVARGYMQHEGSSLNSVTQARAQAMAIGGNVQQRTVAEPLLRRLSASCSQSQKTIRSCAPSRAFSNCRNN